MCLAAVMCKKYAYPSLIFLIVMLSIKKSEGFSFKALFLIKINWKFDLSG
jgi:hypothetical protein